MSDTIFSNCNCDLTAITFCMLRRLDKIIIPVRFEVRCRFYKGQPQTRLAITRLIVGSK